MATGSLLKVEEQDAVQALQQACEKLDCAEGEMILDFSAMRRLAPGALSALEQLAAAADRKEIRITLRGINVDVYKVLKLLKLAPRFSYGDERQMPPPS